MAEGKNDVLLYGVSSGCHFPGDPILLAWVKASYFSTLVIIIDCFSLAEISSVIGCFCCGGSLPWLGKKECSDRRDFFLHLTGQERFFITAT